MYMCIYIYVNILFHALLLGPETMFAAKASSRWPSLAPSGADRSQGASMIDLPYKEPVSAKP